jgi:heat shock transcription factor, other eukaryote
MGSKKKSPQPAAAATAAAADKVLGDVGAPPAGKESAPVVVVPKPPDVAPFLTKVYDMVSDPATDSVISWGAGGGSFVIWDSHAFERHLLPRHFKHNHFTSFIRQLNTYVRFSPNPPVIPSRGCLFPTREFHAVLCGFD